ncbi:4Fe-4S dicluster domain-containing protein [Candidatus Aerophobetes bacterium]|uniref:4Fe-4S dicluster domain-containing protein n=1 Tax=Aerophobetes bacterium TaxID=2030807 RepID=A0A523RT71_UNCAE|nr:MAG: 4Fe-4S dicluster domain-containing protein [Candidatus Aerophobetes bacterium]
MLYDAITEDEDGIASINPEKCDGCGMCWQVCPSKAISMTKPV